MKSPNIIEIAYVICPLRSISDYICPDCQKVSNIFHFQIFQRSNMDFDDEDLETFDDNPRPKTSGREREGFGANRPGTR